jgi:sulfite reductase (NADPH) hemoprotein beta-component
VDSIGVAVDEDAFAITRALLPRTTAYHSIWVDGVSLDLGIGETVAKARASADQANPYMPPPADSDDSGAPVDPLYGKTYLPRKFKTGFAIPPNNDTDIFTNDMGFVAVVENGKLIGYNLLVGGGLGTSHGNKLTYPRLADVIGFITREQVVEVGSAVVAIHRDWGDRTDRKHARIKYVLQEKGVEWFRNELAQRLGAPLPAAKPFIFKGQGDAFGWFKQLDGQWFLGLFIETGRVKDAGDYKLKTALRSIAEKFGPVFRLTATQNLILSDIKEENKSAIEKILNDHGCSIVFNPGLIKGRGMACPALPTCGLALAESERIFPALLAKIEDAQAAAGIANERRIAARGGVAVQIDAVRDCRSLRHGHTTCLTARGSCRVGIKPITSLSCSSSTSIPIRMPFSCASSGVWKTSHWRKRRSSPVSSPWLGVMKCRCASTSPASGSASPSS